MANWDDQRFVLALARNGSIRAAAKSLSVNHTTVSRRIEALEKQLSARLFERTSSGYVLTASGKVIRDAAENMEGLVLSSHRRIEGADAELSGEVYISIPDIFDEWVCDQLASFLIQHPKINIHLTVETAIVDLANREADIALRFTQTPPLDMVGRKVWQLEVAVYASTDYPIDPAKSLANYPWVRWTPAYSQSPVEQWTEDACAGAPSVTRVSTYKSLSRMIENGAGIGCLSPWLAKDNPKLKRISPVIEAASMDVWLLIHPDLRGVKRIGALKELLIGIFESKGNLPIN
jgi:DNA-binding transcriptional LysR family regulator